jgi:CP family cyanate transporter-like MFS transporter
VSRNQPPPAASPRGHHPRLERTLLVIGVAGLGYNLRGSISSLPPVFPELQSSLHLSSPAISFLAATPVICFGVVSGFAAVLARRLGEERVLLGAVIVLAAGLLARGADAPVLLFPGTIAASGAIAVMNVLLSSLIKRRWPQRAGFLIGLYITALSAGAIVGSLVSVPLWNASGGSVALTLGWLAAPAALAALLWLPQAGPGAGRFPAGSRAGTDPAAASAAVRSPAPPRLPVHRYALAWYVTLFMGLQSLVYYACLSWLPSMLRARGESAGGAGDLLALMGVGNLAVSLVVPVAAQRLRSQYVLVVPTALAVGGGLAGLLYAPLGGAVAWALILGAGQNAALALAIFFTAARTPSAASAASLSALAQSVGYLLSSAGPLGVGLLHSATGSWTASVTVLLALTAVMLAAGLMAARPRVLPDPAAGRAAGPTPASAEGAA